ncbi:MAG: hypothetical protein WBW69_19855 [Candidatus Korobacteraceae bacterium]
MPLPGREQARHKPVADMIKEVVEFFVDIKIERADIPVALYRVSADVGGPELARKMTQRFRKVIEKTIETAPDLQSPSRSICHRLDAGSNVRRNALRARGGWVTGNASQSS